MKRNKKLGQAMIEYILLLAIPILIISVLPNLNKTVNMTLNTVGVDLMEDDGGLPPPVVDFCKEEGGCRPEDIVLHPPVAKFELQDNNCGTNIDAIYRKGSSIRIQDLSYDTDPDGHGIIDHTEWTVQKYYPNGGLVRECSTTERNETLKGSRRAGSDSEIIGLTIGMDGYGGLAQYKNCTRDPGTFIVTLKVFDNDGLVSANTFTQTFEIRDLRPSITVSVDVDTLTQPDDDPLRYVSASSTSDSCRFDTPINGDYDDENWGIPEIEYTRGAATLTYDGLRYAYTEVCPRDSNTNKTGKVTFNIESFDPTDDDSLRLKDPDFLASDNGGDFVSAEGADDKMFDYQRHGFKYLSRYIQSEALTPAGLATANAQEIYFETGATNYIKEFENPGIYLYDAMVVDENLISAQGQGRQDPSKAGYRPDVGVAIKVLSPADENYAERCKPIPTEITCPKPQYILGVTKTNISGESYGPYYFSLGLVGASKSDLNLNLIKDENGKSIADKYVSSAADLERLLGLDVFTSTHKYTGGTVTFPVFRPTNDEHLEIKSLAYYPPDVLDSDECKTAGSNKYWATTDGWINDFDFSTLTSGTKAQWKPGSVPSDVWFTIHRPYKEDGSYIYVSGQTVEDLTTDKVPAATAALIKDPDTGKVIEKVELLYGMARNSSAEMDFPKTIATPFEGKISSSNHTELLTGRITRPSNNKITDYKDSAVRSNGQMFAVAPKLQSCPTHDLRPVPKFSYLTTSNTIIPLSISTLGMEPDLSTWNIDTQNPPAGVTCVDEGCFVTITASDSVCGEGTKNCSIKAIRWEYSMYTHEPINKDINQLKESDFENAVPIVHDDALTRYFPLTTVNRNMNQVTSAYPKYESIFYPAGTPTEYRLTELDDSYDSVYGLPTNNNSSGSYIYYGEYGSAEELDPDNEGTKYTRIPTFDFVDGSILDIYESGTVAPNARATYTSDDSVNIPDGNTNSGMFLQAGTSYLYTIEIIDSQGCATSKTLRINVSDVEEEPIAYCNFVDNTVTAEQLANHAYYGGLIVQGRTSDGNLAIFYNGDDPKMYAYGKNVTTKYYTSPLFMFKDSYWASHIVDNDTTVYINDDDKYFLTNYEDPDTIIDQAVLTKSDYNPRVGQIGVGETSLNGILNASYSKVGKKSSNLESAALIDKVTWTAYKATMERGSVQIDDYTCEGCLVEVELGEENVGGVSLIKDENYPEPVGQVVTGNINDYPTFPAGTFKDPGYYIIDLTVSYEKDGERLTSQPTQCKMRITTPTLDFKCPWGETWAELENTKLTVKAKSFGVTEPSESIFSQLTADTNYLNGNHNPYITNFEYTHDINRDANGLDLIETSQSPSYGEVTIIDFEPTKLNKDWSDLMTYGVKDRGLLDYEICRGADPDCESFEHLFEINSFNGGITAHERYNAIKDSPTLQPLTIKNPKTGWSETMSLQGWLVRERYSRDGENSNGSYKIPAYLGALDFLTYEQKLEEERLVNLDMIEEEEEENVLDTLIIALDELIPELTDLRPNKIKIANDLKIGIKNRFTFMDLQPSAVRTPLYSANMKTDYTYTKYTGNIFAYENKQVVQKCTEPNSIRKCSTVNYGESAYGSYTYEGGFKYITTPFAGKYLAAKRFQDLNYKNLMGDKDKFNPIYAGYEGFTGHENDTTRRFNVFSLNNFYINPQSIYLNQTALSEKITSLKTGLEYDLTSKAQDVKFTDLPPTLDSTAFYLESRNPSEYNLDTTTLNAVAWEHAEQLGKHGNKNEKAITYIRVNAVDMNTPMRTENNGTKIYNSYSKLCPILVEKLPPYSLPYANCPIQYSLNGSTVYKPDESNGLLINPSSGEVFVAGQDVGRANSYNLEWSNRQTNTVNDSDIESILAPKAFHESRNSKWNVSGIELDFDSQVIFITSNLGTSLERAVYSFYWDNGFGNRKPINANIVLEYSLPSRSIASVNDTTAINDLANEMIQSFHSQYYSSSGVKASADLASQEITDTETGKINWNFAKLGYTITYERKEGTQYVSMLENPSINCGFYVAQEVLEKPDPPTVPVDPYNMEIGSWDYRIEYLDNYHKGDFIHWDRTYNYTKYKNTGKILSINPPNRACLWKTQPSTNGGFSAKNAQVQLIGGYNHTSAGRCAVGGFDGQEINFNSYTNASNYGIIDTYSLLGPSDYAVNKQNGSLAGFYVASLYVTHGPEATVSEIKSACKNGIATNGSSIGEPGAWCYKGTLYAITGPNNNIPGLSYDDVRDIIHDQNGPPSSGLWNGLTNRLNDGYGNPRN